LRLEIAKALAAKYDDVVAAMKGPNGGRLSDKKGCVEIHEILYAVIWGDE
jgi:hypothetical protein